ncbi:ceramidase domain-containing protein [Aureivirga marina]|uniref:ceramidase domain-containing protein n=1 Tax=Aureivirga marina TaxID=1182451 RepID=UPI0018C9D051|nr:ceramidase domain-containing protein [Aureivirga marina]
MKKEKVGKWLLISILLIAAIVILLINPIHQDENYHIFSDENTILGIPNFWNVISNFPFIIAGIIGLRKLKFSENTLKMKLFFTSIILVGFGSAYYHFIPNSTTLVWDRLPMTLAFMTLFSMLLSEFISEKLGKKIFIPLLVFGIYSIIFWKFGKNEDLRLYVFIQFYPMLAIPIILLFFKPKKETKKFYWYLLLCYVIAKVFEHFDFQIFHKMQWISGHSLKHIFAAFGIYLLTFTIDFKQKSQEILK